METIKSVCVTLGQICTIDNEKADIFVEIIEHKRFCSNFKTWKNLRDLLYY